MDDKVRRGTGDTQRWATRVDDKVSRGPEDTQKWPPR